MKPFMVRPFMNRYHQYTDLSKNTVKFLSQDDVEVWMDGKRLKLSTDKTEWLGVSDFSSTIGFEF